MRSHKSTLSEELLQRQLHKGLEAARQRWENCLGS